MKSSSATSKKKGQKRRIRFFLFFVLIFFIWTGYTAYLQSGLLSDKEQQLANLKEEQAAAQQLQAELTYKASRLNDKDYIAELARKNHYFSKPGEIIYVIPDQK